MKKEFVELYDDEDIDQLVTIVCKNCSKMGCDDCKYKGHIDGESCEPDVIMELWRKWRNALNTLKERCGNHE